VPLLYPIEPRAWRIDLKVCPCIGQTVRNVIPYLIRNPGGVE
jgi:hypothetical protein